MRRMDGKIPSLAFIRRRSGYSQQALADAVGVTKQSISNYEAGRNAPSFKVLLAIAETLNASIDDLMSLPPKP